MTTNASQHEMHQRMVGEVLELGQALFDTVVEAATAPLSADGGDWGPLPADDMRAAADEFFTALRILLESQTRAFPNYLLRRVEETRAQLCRAEWLIQRRFEALGIRLATQFWPLTSVLFDVTAPSLP